MVNGEVTESTPNAPMLSQREFANSTTENITQFAETPVSEHVPEFKNIDLEMLPTPISFGPNSPLQMLHSPTSPGSIVIDKRRTLNKNRINTEVSKLPTCAYIEGNFSKNTRIISEYIARSDDVSIKPERSLSLSGIVEDQNSHKALKKEAQISENTVGNSDIEEELNDDLDFNHSYIDGYLFEDANRMHRWYKEKKIGAGNFSTVSLYKTEERVNSLYSEVAVKTLKYPDELLQSDSPNSPKFRELLSRVESSLKREISVLNSLNHPCIVKLFGLNDIAFLTEDKPLSSRRKLNSFPRCDMIMSYCSGGDLFDLASQHKLPDWLVQRIVSELCVAVKYLHQNLIVHRDIKLENVLIKFPLDKIVRLKTENTFFNSTNLVELADFGLCKRTAVDEMCTTRCGSEDYVSPEILLGLPYDGKLSDSWAVGVIIYALLEDRLPFDPLPTKPSRRMRSTAHRIATCSWKWCKLVDIDNDAKTLVEKTLVRKSERWNMDQICKTDYIQSIIKDLNFFRAASDVLNSS